nr:AraC family transcriptional regulator [Klebsiella variicola]
MKQIHRDIGRPWSLKLLAAEAGMSRSAFAVHFKDITGITPGIISLTGECTVLVFY